MRVLILTDEESLDLRRAIVYTQQQIDLLPKDHKGYDKILADKLDLIDLELNKSNYSSKIGKEHVKQLITELLESSEYLRQNNEDLKNEGAIEEFIKDCQIIDLIYSVRVRMIETLIIELSK